MWWMWVTVGLALECDRDAPDVWDCVYQAARSGDEDALPFAEALAEAQPSPQAWLTLGNLYELRADPAAIGAYEKAAGGFAEAGKAQRRLFAELNLATALRHSGDVAGGKARLAAALEWTADDAGLNAIARLEWARLISQVGGDLGAVYRDLLALEPALAEMPPHGTRLWWHTRASLETQLDRPQHAASSFMELAAFSEGLGDAYGAAGARGNALQLLQEGGVVAESWWEMWREALAAAEGETMLPHRAQLWCMAAAQPDAPDGALAECVSTAAELPPDAVVALDARILSAAAEGDHAELLAIAEETRAVSDDTRLRALEVAASTPGAGQDGAIAALLSAIERSSARISDPLLAARFERRWSSAYLQAALKAASPRDALAIHERLHRWRIELRRARHRSPDAAEALQAVVAQIESARQDGDADAVASLIAEEGRLLAAHVPPWSEAAARDIAPLRAPGEALVSFVLGEAQGQAWVLDDSGERLVSLPGLPRAQAAGIASLLANQPEEADSALQALASALWAPLGLAEGAELVVVVDGGMQALGPTALAARGPALAALIEVPSLHAWAWWRSNAEPTGETTLLVGDIPSPAAGDDVPRSVTAALPAASRELAHAAARRRSPLLLTGADATEAAVEGHLPGAAMLHFATHAVADANDPGSSAVFLAPGGGRDGRWTAREIAAADLTGAVVLLSACSGADGEPIGAGVLGLSQSFLEAGARAVVASRWPIRDEAAARYSAALHDALSDGATIGQAAHAARAAVDPATAAAFTLLGDGRAQLPPAPSRAPRLAGAVLMIILLGGGIWMVWRRD